MIDEMEERNMEQFSLEEYLKNPERKIVTGGGEKVRIICTDLHCRFDDVCIVACVTNHGGNEIVRSYTAQGTPSFAEECYNNNLFFAPEKRSRWVFLYKDDCDGCIHSSSAYLTKDDAVIGMQDVADVCWGLTEITWEE